MVSFCLILSLSLFSLWKKTEPCEFLLSNPAGGIPSTSAFPIIKNLPQERGELIVACFIFRGFFSLLSFFLSSLSSLFLLLSLSFLSLLSLSPSLSRKDGEREREERKRERERDGIGRQGEI